MKVALPSGRVVVVTEVRGGPASAAQAGILFAEARARFADGTIVVRDVAAKAPLDVGDFALVDFHALRAIATHEGWLAEEEVSVPCVNCDAELRVRPCRAMPLGPFLERALDDEELDARLADGVPHPIAPLALPGGGRAETITLRTVTLREAEPLHRALAAPTLSVDAHVVTAMGITALGEERDPARIAEALRDVDDEGWDEVARAFIALHYPLRLAGIVRCEACGARNDVDAPFDRELDFGDPPPVADARPFVRFRTFAAKARALAEAIIEPAHEAEIAFVVEGGVAAVDEGGIALLGAYLPGSPGDGGHPSRPHEITVYYRTFRAMWEDEGPYDWVAELEETVEHEYEHFLAELAGGDPVDDEERRAITDEAIRLHGKATLLTHEVGHLGRDVAGFWRRTWLLWVIVLVVVALLSIGSR